MNNASPLVSFMKRDLTSRLLPTLMIVMAMLHVSGLQAIAQESLQASKSAI
ncbi:MAG: hypothetical protein K8F91_11570 [Candidatus Obscuribacterales bacterium]|nr:hypothetical protein [Candidatus Obscuribacterales bacterium]